MYARSVFDLRIRSRPRFVGAEAVPALYIPSRLDRVGFAEFVVRPATSGRTCWLGPSSPGIVS